MTVRQRASVSWASVSRASMAVLGLVVAAGGLGLSACSRAGLAGGNSVTTVASASSATIDVRTVTPYGRVLVTSSGQSLYLFTADPKGASACQGSCLPVWPPLLVGGQIKAGPGVDAKLLSSIQAHGGGHQVLYNGHPLYTFEQDGAAGMTRGENVQTYGGTWWLVSPAGNAVTGTEGK